MAQKRKSEMEDDEIVRYWDAYFAAFDTLMDAKQKLQRLEDGATELGERSRFRAERLRAEADLELMRARRTAFMSDSARVDPPTQDEVDDILALQKTVASKAATRAEAAAIVSGVTAVMQKFSELDAVA